ncbi:MAG: signal peptidase I [Oscillospiraceae bacterium]|nr:signal peptidase I [Oscillospiraceae bacterium]
MLRKIFSRIYFLLVSVLILIGAILCIFYICQVRPYVVQTGSMTPAIPVGSVCFVNQHISYENIHTGDVIAFRMGGNATVTHRVVRVETDGMITKGDANHVEDSALVTKENYVGKTIFWIPEVGNFVRYLRTRQGSVFFVSGAVVLILSGFLLDGEKEISDKKNSS